MGKNMSGSMVTKMIEVLSFARQGWVDAEQKSTHRYWIDRLICQWSCGRGKFRGRDNPTDFTSVSIKNFSTTGKAKRLPCLYLVTWKPFAAHLFFYPTHSWHSDNHIGPVIFPTMWWTLSSLRHWWAHFFSHLVRGWTFRSARPDWIIKPYVPPWRTRP